MPGPTTLFLLLCSLLVAHGYIGTSITLSGPSQCGSVFSMSTPALTDNNTGVQVTETDSTVHIWSLGGNGWALRVGDKMLIFDYVGGSGTASQDTDDTLDLERGRIDPGEIRSYKVYVFVTHSHQDHYDPSILEWQNQIDQITYFFGWQAGNNPEHHYMIGPRANTQFDDLSVYTINSHHDGVPEVAYLVEVDGIVIYHNGDYRSTYLEDFKFLQSVTEHIDIAFVIGWPYVTHQHFQQAKLLAEMFDPVYIFAICREGNEDKSRQFARLLAEHGVKSSVLYAQHRGDYFTYSRKAIN